MIERMNYWRSVRVKANPLDAELSRLKQITNMGHELKIHWQPDTILNKEGMVLRGKVVGNVILIFDKELEQAKETVRHEFIEYLIDKAVEPYRNLLNNFMLHFQNEAYEKREECVKALLTICDMSSDNDIIGISRRSKRVKGMVY